MFTNRLSIVAVVLIAIACDTSTEPVAERQAVSATASPVDILSPSAPGQLFPADAVTIVQHSEFSGTSTFVATGAINDSGPITLDSVNATALPSPLVGTAHYIRTYHGDYGTFTLKLNTLLTATDVPWLWAENGHWVLVSGTGAYENMSGVGREEGIRDFANQVLDVTFSGKVH